jgi:hypothetical protein
MWRHVVCYMVTEEEGTRILRNVGNYLANNAVGHPTKLKPSRRLSELQISQGTLKGIDLKNTDFCIMQSKRLRHDKRYC